MRESANELLGKANADQASRLVRGLDILKDHPDSIATGIESSAMTPISENTISWFSNEFGGEIAQDVVTVSEMVRLGKITKGQALQTVMAKPELAKAMMKASLNPEIQFQLAL